jgi:hypothetical protein
VAQALDGHAHAPGRQLARTSAWLPSSDSARTGSFCRNNQIGEKM